MQDRYIGDVGDFGKYGLLRALAGDGELRLGVVWYLVQNEERNEDGRYTEYLGPRHESRFRPCDPELYDALRVLIDARRRSVAAVRDTGVLPADTIFYEHRLSYEGVPIASRLAERDRWCSGALEATLGRELVFVDPDNGVAGAAMRRGRSDIKHVFIDELAPYIERGQSVVVLSPSCEARDARGADQTAVQRVAGSARSDDEPHRAPLPAVEPARVLRAPSARACGGAARADRRLAERALGCALRGGKRLTRAR